jgi:hypothetical protein
MSEYMPPKTLEKVDEEVPEKTVSRKSKYMPPKKQHKSRMPDKMLEKMSEYIPKTNAR